MQVGAEVVCVIVDSTYSISIISRVSFHIHHIFREVQVFVVFVDCGFEGIVLWTVRVQNKTATGQPPLMRQHSVVLTFHP